MPHTFGKLDEKVNLNDCWLSTRRELFHRICVPSVEANQKRVNNFNWFVIFDEDTPLEYINSLNGAFTPILANTKLTYTNKILELLDLRDEEIFQFVTVRLDNDDALSETYMSFIDDFSKSNYSNYLGSTYGLLFRTGLELDNQNNLYIRNFPNNSFSALIENCKPQELETIYSVDHNELSKRFPVFAINNKAPMWLMNVHGGNVGNQIKGQLITSPLEKESLLNNFSFLKDKI